MAQRPTQIVTGLRPNRYHKILEPAANSVEIWHYVHESLPSGIPYQEVLFQFITKQGYGKNVLQRDPTALTTLEKSRQIARRNA